MKVIIGVLALFFLSCNSTFRSHRLHYKSLSLTYINDGSYDTVVKDYTVLLRGPKLFIIKPETEITEERIKRDTLVYYIDKKREVRRKKLLGYYYNNPICSELVYNSNEYEIIADKHVLKKGMSKRNVYCFTKGDTSMLNVGLGFPFLKGEYTLLDTTSSYKTSKRNIPVVVFNIDKTKYLGVDEKGYSGFQLVYKRFSLPVYTQLKLSNNNVLIIKCESIR